MRSDTFWLPLQVLHFLSGYLKMNVTKLQLDNVLLSLLGSEDLVAQWWLSPNFALGLQSPIDLWEDGEVGCEMVTNYVLGQINADYS